MEKRFKNSYCHCVDYQVCTGGCGTSCGLLEGRSHAELARSCLCKHSNGTSKVQGVDIMVKTLGNDSFETFSPLPPPLSPGQPGDAFGNDEEAAELSKLAEVPAAKRRVVRRPQPKLDSQRLISEKGLPALRTLFDNVHFKGKGHEAEDVRLLMQKMENWAHRLYPKLQFEDFMDRVEKLGAKKEVQTCLKRIRLDMPLTHEDFTGEDDAPLEHDILEDSDPFSSQRFPSDPQGPIHSTPAPAGPPAPSLTEDQRQRMELNRQRALERKMARQQQLMDSQPLDSSLQADEPSVNTAEHAVNYSQGQDCKEDEPGRSSPPQLSIKASESFSLCKNIVTEPTPPASNSSEDADKC
ncbi:TIMELESS-interacting protein isoform X1 [Syngnathus acus]|uniref:TIMELESS-interacting protein isoform X1 n=2 Tax=Syngnathus acus TaxID=161584 RepID=UPI001885B045|nr:TIMELESS-interacting protein isoform X1 [Syngnathus acus]